MMLTVDDRCLACPQETSIYRMVGRCLNCGADPILVLTTSGHEVNRRACCPVCGTSNVNPSRLATDDEIPEAE